MSSRILRLQMRIRTFLWISDAAVNPLSQIRKRNIKLWHARLGGVGFARLQELSKHYPSIFKIPSTATFDEICQCCQRSSMRKSNAAAEIGRVEGFGEVLDEGGRVDVGVDAHAQGLA